MVVWWACLTVLVRRLVLDLSWAAAVNVMKASDSFMQLFFSVPLEAVYTMQVYKTSYVRYKLRFDIFNYLKTIQII